MTKNEITAEEIKFEARKINDEVGAFIEACQQEEYYGGPEEAAKHKKGYKRAILEQWNEVHKLILELDVHSK